MNKTRIKKEEFCKDFRWSYLVSCCPFIAKTAMTGAEMLGLIDLPG